MQAFWMELLSATLVCAIIVTAIYLVYRGVPFEQGVPEGLQTLGRVMGFIARRFQAAIGMMLGFYIKANFYRWNDVKSLEGNVIESINSAAMQLTWTIKPKKTNTCNNSDTDADATKDEDSVFKENDESYNMRESTTSTGNQHRTCDANSARIQLVRWLNLSHAIVIGELYEGTPSPFSPVDKLIDTGLATKAELMFLKKVNSPCKYAAPLFWFRDFMAKLRDEELFGVDDECFNQVAPHILNLRNSLEKLYRARDGPIPLVYKQLVNITVRSYMFILLVDAVLVEISRLEVYEDGETVYLSTSGTFSTILMYAFEYFLFVGWLLVADLVGNPFRQWADELDWNTYVSGTSLSSFLLGSEFGELHASMPKPMVCEVDDDVVAWRTSCGDLDGKSSYRNSKAGDSSGSEEAKKK